MQYQLKIIQGTEDYVLKELQEKFPSVTLSLSKGDTIEFDSEISDIDEFRKLYSALAITDGKLERNLYRRDWRKEFVPAGINPALAYVMCMAARIQTDDVVLDPFCGGGTIPITASLYFNPKKVLGSDVSGKAIDITIRNAQEAGISKNKLVIFRSNVAQLKLQKDSVSKIITNLPFGVRTGNHEENLKVYKAFASKAKSILKEQGLLVILTQEKTLLEESFVDFKLIKKFDVHQGGLIPTVFIYKKQ